MASPKICKSCKNIIPAGSKYCPVCGAKAPRGLPTWAIVLICVLGVFILIGAFNSDKAEKVESTPSARASSEPTVRATSTPKPTPTPEPVFTIGDTAEMQDVRVTLHDVRTSYGESFLTPDSGNVFLIFDIEIENNRDTEIAIAPGKMKVDTEKYLLSFLCCRIGERKGRNDEQERRTASEME